jgi:hypothetical protein
MQLHVVHFPGAWAIHSAPASGGVGPIRCRVAHEADGRIGTAPSAAVRGDPPETLAAS